MIIKMVQQYFKFCMCFSHGKLTMFGKEIMNGKMACFIIAIIVAILAFIYIKKM